LPLYPKGHTSQGRGYGLDLFSGLMGKLNFQVRVSVEDGLGFSPPAPEWGLGDVVPERSEW
jgi:hypothetical protein